MNKLIPQKTKLSDEQIVAAYQEAQEAEISAGLKILICGQMLIEKRNQLLNGSSFSHSGKMEKIREIGVSKSEDTKFATWLDRVGIAGSTAYRWMDSTSRVMRAQLGLSMADELPDFIEVEGTVIPLSQALLAPPDELPAKAREFRQGIFDFMEDKTLSQAVRAAQDGDDAAHRITRAANGKGASGAGGSGDRKAFAKFTALKLKHITTFLSNKLTPNEQARIVTAFETSLEQWPRWVVSALAEKVKGELKLDEDARRARHSLL